MLFDLDGVLLNSYYFWFHLFNHTLKHFGHKPISLKVFRKNWGKSTEEDVKKFMPESTIEEVKSHFFRNMQLYKNYLKVNPLARTTLEKLRRLNYKLGCVTNSHRRIIKWQLEATGLKKYFQVIISADDVQRPKPEPEMLYKACKKLGVRPYNTAFVGDTRTDLIAGKRAGCVVIGYKIKNRIKIESLKALSRTIKDLEIKE